MAIGVDKAVTGRLTVSGQKFEVLVDPDKALEMKKGADVKIDDILAYPVVYKDVGTSEEVSHDDLQKAFGTTDPRKAAEKIVKDGEIQLTTEQRRAMAEQRKNEVASIISRKGVNPQTSAPHPQQRVLNAMDQAGVMVDPFASADSQVDKALKAIKGIIPVKFERLLIQVRVPAEHSGRAFPAIKSFGNLKSEQWLGDGSLQVEVEVFGGVQDDLLKKVADATRGDYESKVVKREDV